MPTSVSRRSPTARRSGTRSRRSRFATSSRPVVRVSTPTCVIDIEPTGPGGGYEFVNKITGGRIPTEYIPAVDQGVQEAMASGVLAGYPVVDIRVTLQDGSCARRRLVRDGVQDRRLDGVQGGGQEGEARPARADLRRRGRHARGVHGRRDRRPLRSPRPDRVDGPARSATGSSRHRCRWPRCSVTSPSFAVADAGSSNVHACSSTRTRKYPSRSQKKSSQRFSGEPDSQ